jgi:tetratricopeptide (TPR) repeat protein
MNPQLRSRVLLLGVLLGLILILDPTPTPSVYSNYLDSLKHAIESERFDDAIRISRELQTLYPENRQFRILTLDLALQNQQFDLVEELLNSTAYLDLEEEDWDCYRIQAEFHLASLLSQTEILLEIPEGCLPHHVYIETIHALMEIGDIQTAQVLVSTLDTEQIFSPSDQLSIGLLRSVQFPQQALALLQLYVDTQEAPSPIAEDLLKTIRQASLQDSESYTLLQVGLSLIGYGEWALAREAMITATELEPEFPEAWAYLGLASDRTGRDGYPMLVKAISLNPQSSLLRFLMAKHWSHAEKFDLAIKELEKALALDPQNPAIAADLGEANLAAGNLLDAKEYFLQAAQNSGNTSEFWLLLADFSFRTETEIQPMGLQAVRTAWFLGSDQASFYDGLGYGYYLLGEYDLADRFLTAGLQLDPTHQKLQYHYGLLLLSTGQVLDAKATLEYAVAIDPQGPIGQMAARTLSWIPQD